MEDCTIVCQLLTWGKENKNEAENARTGIRSAERKAVK